MLHLHGHVLPGFLHADILWEEDDDRRQFCQICGREYVPRRAGNNPTSAIIPTSSPTLPGLIPAHESPCRWLLMLSTPLPLSVIRTAQTMVVVNVVVVNHH